jgi:hypothetical protein
MSAEILSMAIWQPLPGKESAALATTREIGSVVAAKGYGRDLVYRGSGSQYVLLRFWKSPQSRGVALEDADLLRCWARLANEIQMLKVYETLTEVPSELAQ